MSPRKKKNAVALDLASLHHAGAISAIDRYLAKTIARLSDTQTNAFLLATALVSRQSGRGHICVDLNAVAGKPITTDDGTPLEGLTWPDVKTLTQVLETSAAVETTDQPPSRNPTQLQPLVLDHAQRLYLRRLYAAQEQLADLLEQRTCAPSLELDESTLENGLARFFSETSTNPDDPEHGQRLATLVALRRPFCIITGGPGTGKTHTVARLLALLVEQSLAADPDADPPAVKLLAPTGKAAARLAESIKEAKAQLDCDPKVKAAIPEQAATIHRALRLYGGGGKRSRYAHNAANPLAADLVLVDEASMVDLTLMTQLVDATPPSARLVLLGDRHQLTSIEAGAILGDLCSPPSGTAITKPSGDLGIADSVAELSHSFRFAAQSGIGNLADAISQDDPATALALLGSDDHPDLQLITPPTPTDEHNAYESMTAGRELLLEHITTGLAPFLAATTPDSRLDALAGFRVLCAHRQGYWGSAALNDAIEDRLEEQDHIRRRGQGQIYDGRPILITSNNYDLQLWNGDVGIIAPDPDAKNENPDPTAPADASLIAHFAAPDGTSRRFAPGRLPPHETVFAMSVHKSQGSEFDHVLVVLPTLVSRVLSRELLYTAVTRAKSSVTICAPPDVITATIARRVERASGLSERLWGNRG